MANHSCLQLPLQEVKCAPLASEVTAHTWYTYTHEGKTHIHTNPNALQGKGSPQTPPKHPPDTPPSTSQSAKESLSPLGKSFLLLFFLSLPALSPHPGADTISPSPSSTALARKRLPLGLQLLLPVYMHPAWAHCSPVLSEQASGFLEAILTVSPQGCFLQFQVERARLRRLS